MEENSSASLAEIAEKLNAERENPPAGQSLRLVSPSTVRRAVKGIGMRSCPAQAANDGKNQTTAVGAEAALPFQREKGGSFIDDFGVAH